MSDILCKILSKLKEHQNMNRKLYESKYEGITTKVLRSGIEIKDVSTVLGHSKIETTENYYVCCTKENLRNVTETVEKENNY